MSTRPRRGLLPLLLLLLAPASSVAAEAPVALPKPAFPAPVGAVSAAPGAPQLQLISSTPNAITDVRAWFRRNDIAPDEWRIASGGEVPGAALPRALPRSFAGQALQRAIRDASGAILIYGPDGASGRYVVGASTRTGAIRWAYDLKSFWTAPGTPRPAEARQEVLWAAVRAGTLYVETTHAGFAADSRRRNAYVSAIDLDSSRVLWRSPALVANASTFVVLGDALITGYGFTSEPDALYVLDRRTGRPVGTLAVPSGPEQIYLRRGTLFVRTYDHDLTVRIVRR